MAQIHCYYDTSDGQKILVVGDSEEQRLENLLEFHKKYYAEDATIDYVRERYYQERDIFIDTDSDKKVFPL